MKRAYLFAIHWLALIGMGVPDFVAMIMILVGWFCFRVIQKTIERVKAEEKSTKGI